MENTDYSGRLRRQRDQAVACALLAATLALAVFASQSGHPLREAIANANQLAANLHDLDREVLKALDDNRAASAQVEAVLRQERAAASARR